MTAPARANTRHLPILAFGGDLIGRETECAAIAAWLNHPRRRLLTITGPGGVGKTHLAYHALQTAPASHRVIFVSLAPIATGDLLMPALCHAMRLDERSGAPLLDLIAGAIGDGPVVLALDNLEHLPEASAIVAMLLERLPTAKILATSRASLNLRSEEVLVLEALPIPDADDARFHDEIGDNAAVQLFVQQVRRVDRAFRLTPENAGTIAEICRRLDGLPLAIELVSSRAPAMSLSTMLARMDDQLSLLHAQRPDAPERQWSMHASITWSLDLLTSDDQAGLQRLAVFPGRFSAEDANEIAMVSPDSLEALTRSHLVLMQRDDHLAASFQLSEPIKQFCLEALRAAGEESRCRSRYAEAITRFIERNQTQLNSAARKEAMAVLIERMDDINAALAWGLASGDLTTTVRIATGMQHAWAVVVHWSIGLRWLREIVAAIDRSGFDDDEAVTALMLTTGLVALHAEQRDESRRSFERAVQLARSSGDRARLIDALLRSLPTLYELRDLDEAERLLAEAHQLIDSSTPEKSVQMASTQLGILSTHQGHYARALTALQPGLARARRLENPHSLAFHQRLVGDALHGLGNDEESREFYLAAIDVQSWERSTQYFLTLLGLIRLELKAGRSKQAAYWLAEYLDGRRARREMTRLREGLFEIARLAQLQGNAEFVAKYLGAASNEPGVARCRGHASLEREMVAATNNALGAVRFTALFMRGQSESLTKVVEAAIAYAVEVAGKFRDTPVAEPDSETSDVQLTSREMQVLQCLAEGMTDREIGDALYISHQTASTHVRNILRKLDAPSRSMAVVVAVRHGLVTLSQ